MTANNTPEVGALAKAEAEAAQAIQRASGTAQQFGSAADQRHLEEQIARGRARAAAAKAGVNTAVAEGAAVTPPAPAQAPVKPAPVKPAAFPGYGSSGQTGYAAPGGSPAPHVNVPAPAPVAAAPETPKAPKAPGKVSQYFGKVEESAAGPMGKAAQHGARKWMGRIALPFAAVDMFTEYQQIDKQFEAGEVKAATTNTGKLVGKYGGMLAMGALGAKVGAGVGTFAIPIPIVGTVAGSVGGFLLGGAMAVGGYLLGDKVGGAVGSLLAPAKDQKEIDAASSKHELTMKKYLEAAKAEALGGNTPALHQATLAARQEYIAARKDSITETDAQREANMKALDGNFATLSKRYAEQATAAAAAYEKAKADYKGILTSSVMAGDTVTEAQQNAINAAGISMLRARRATVAGRAETVDASKADVMQWGEQSVAEAERARAATGPRPGASTGRAPAPATVPSPAAVPAPAAGAGGTETRRPVTPVPPDVLSPPAPAPAAAPAKESNWGKMLSEIPILGPILGFLGIGGDPDKKSPLGNMLGMLGDTKNGLSGMGAMAAGLAVFAAVANMMDGGLMGMIVGLIAATIVVPMISAAMKSFGDSPKPDGQRSPAVGGPQMQRTVDSPERQVTQDGPGMRTASLDQATQQANLQRTAALEVATVEGNVPAPHVAGVPAAGGGGLGVGGGRRDA